MIKDRLTTESWNGVPLFEGEAKGSIRARYQTVVNGTHVWFQIVVAPCHDTCPEDLVETVYFENDGRDATEYTEQRFNHHLNPDDSRLSTGDRNRLKMYEVTPQIAGVCLGSKMPVQPHIDGVY